MDHKHDFDITIVDGTARDLCARAATGKLADNGFIILDNSEAYPSVAKYLREQGLIQVDFIGAAPLVHTWQSTSLFFKPSHKIHSDDAPKWIPGMTIFPKDWKPM